MPRCSMRIIGGAVLLIALSACGSGSSSPSGSPSSAPPADPLKVAADTCRPWGQTGDEIVRYESGSVLIDFSNYDTTGYQRKAFRATQCMLDELNAPGSVWQQMGRATALSGTEEQSWDGFTATWSYSGADDGGFSATFDAE